MSARLRAAVVYSRHPEAELDADDDRFEELDRPEVPRAVAAALERLGHDAFVLEDREGLVPSLRLEPPDFVFNLAEGYSGRAREAIVPALCEHLAIPYTGSDALALCATLDKDVARRLVAPQLRVAPGALVEPGGPLPDVPLPAIVKPLCEGSSKGIRDGACLARDAAELATRIREISQRYAQPVLVEAFVAGPEVTAAVLDDPQPWVAALMQVIPRQGDPDTFVYSLEVKRDFRRRVRYAIPPELPAPTVERLRVAALAAFRALGCRDVARVDFRVASDGIPVFLEANPLPGLSPEKGDIVLATRGAGMDYDELVGRIAARAVAEARARRHTPDRGPAARNRDPRKSARRATV